MHGWPVKQPSSNTQRDDLISNTGRLQDMKFLSFVPSLSSSLLLSLSSLPLSISLSSLPLRSLLPLSVHLSLLPPSPLSPCVSVAFCIISYSISLTCILLLRYLSLYLSLTHSHL